MSETSMKPAFRLTLLAVLAFAAACASQSPSSSRQDEVARKGAVVMPFDLAKTTHVFDDRPDGGIETVKANDPSDAEQAALIRSHLAHEAQRFARGDFSDPAAIHGAGMPGMAALERAGAKLRVAYREVPGGASLTYASADPGVVAAIHEWFAAQRSDHAAHGHMHGMMRR
jgi:hypothetical protein